MKVGNIVSTTKIDNLDDFNVVESMDNIIHGLPTLIIGFDVAVSVNPDLDVIKRKVSDSIFWTFRKKERRAIHEEDIYYFKRFCYGSLVNKLTYFFVDPLQLKYRAIKRLIGKLYSSESIVSYKHENMVYSYMDNILFGFDLELLEFMGLNKEKTISKIISKSKVFLTKEEIFIEYKNKVESLDNQIKFIPYLYSIEHG